MKRALAFTTVLCFYTSATLAFNGSEHRDLSNIAFLAARTLLPQERDDQIAIVTTSLFGQGLSFGNVTEAVDWFQGPRLLTDTSVGLCRLCEREHHRGAWYWKNLATHHDIDHFQGEALAAYLRFHSDALAAARHDLLSSALLSEAVALHFLEDILAAGHMATPRYGLHDAAAGSLHDKYNDLGLPIRLNVSQFPTDELKNILVELPKASSACGECELKVTDEEICAFEKLTSLIVFGDGRLSTKDASAQKVLILILATHSVMEVMRQTSRQSSPLLIQPCFNPRSAVRVGRHLEDPYSASGGFSVVPYAEAYPNVINLCDENAYAQYDLRSVPTLNRSWYRTDALATRYTPGWSINAAPRQSLLSFGPILRVTDPNHTVALRDASGKITRETFGQLPLEYLAAYAVMIRGDRYEAFGVDAEAAFHIGATESIFAGARRYSGYGRDIVRFDYGARVSFGFQVINFNVELRRGHHFTSDGALVARTFVVPGIDINISKSWFGLLHELFARKSPVCSKSTYKAACAQP